jgi:hypothetical protein
MGGGMWLTAGDQVDESITRASAVQVLAERLVLSEQIVKSCDWNQPVSDDQYHRLPIFKNERLHRSAANFGWAA